MADDSAVADGRSIADAYRTQAPDTAPPPAATQGDTIAPGLRNYLSPAPNTEYGTVLPFARDTTTGAIRWALPNALRDPALGALDLVEGPTTGTVTPAATMALAGLATGGQLVPSIARGTGKAVAEAAAQNALDRAAPLSPAFKASPVAPELAQSTAPVGPTSPVPNAPPPAANFLNPTAAAANPAEAAALAAIPEKLPSGPIMPIVTKAQAEAQADKIIQHFAGSGPTTGTTTPIIPGTGSTLADITGNPGLATLQRGFQGVQPEAFQMLKDANATTRGAFLAKLTGQTEDVAAAKAAVDAQTTPLREAAFANKTPADPAPVVAEIDKILASPAGQSDAVQAAMTNVRGKLTTDRATGKASPQTDAEQLYGIDKAIGTSITPLARGTSSDQALATRELMQVRDVLRQQIEAAAPGFRDYMATHAEGMRAVEGMRYLQGKNLTDAYGNTTLAKLDAAIKGIETQRALPGARPADSISDTQYNGLVALRDSMRLEGKTQTSGKFLSPGTFQDFATNSTVGSMAAHPLVTMGAGAIGAGLGAATMLGGPIGAAIGIGGRMAVGAQQRAAQRMLTNALQERLMNVGNKGLNALNPK